jgi:hypothetical protein
MAIVPAQANLPPVNVVHFTTLKVDTLAVYAEKHPGS